MNPVPKSAIVLFAVVLMNFGCERQHEQVDVTCVNEFRDGDLVLRCGYGAESRVVIARSDAIFSHIGILQYDSLRGEWMVIHAVPGENEPNEPEYLKREPILSFYARERAYKGAWMRINCSDEVARNAAEYCRKKADERICFDNDYLLEDTTAIYCCELVWLAYMREGLDITDGERYEVPTIICKEGKCIFPANIEHGKRTLFVKLFNTKQS